MNALLNSVISVEVYRGPDRNPETDKLVGTAIFGSESWVDGALVGSQNSVAAVLASPEGVTATLPVRPAESPAGGGGEEDDEDVDEGKAGDHHPEFAGTCEVTITITADEALLAYTRGSRVFTVVTTGVQSLLPWNGKEMMLLPKVEMLKRRRSPCAPLFQDNRTARRSSVLAEAREGL